MRESSFVVRAWLLLLLLISFTSNSMIRAFTYHSSITKLSSISTSSSSSSSNKSSAVTEEEEEVKEEETWKSRIKILCTQRNIPFERIKNARDLTSVHNSPIQPNRVIRMGKVSDATVSDVQVLYEELEVRTLVDLRSRTELRDEMNGVHAEEGDDDDEKNGDDVDVYDGFTDLIWHPRKVIELSSEMSSEMGVKEMMMMHSGNVVHDELELEVVEDGVVAIGGAAVMTKSDSDRKERHFVALMNEFKYVKGTLKKLRKRDVAKAVLKSPGAIISRRVRTNIKSVFLKEINEGGLPMLNELVLRMAGPGIKYVLDLCADKDRHPVAIYCTAGKDRTGILASIILAVVGVPDEDIVEDYSLSANVYAEINDHKAMVGALSQRNLDAKTFLGAPPEVMQETLDTIRKNYGSVEGYMDTIGFDSQDRERLKKALIL